MSAHSRPQISTSGGSSAHDNEDAEFSQFQKLPKEIRLEIWGHALQRPRLLCLYVADRPGQKEGTQEANAVEHSILDSQYDIFVRGFQVMSKYLRVNAESRAVALAFYRVHLPCIFIGESFPGRRKKCPGILHFNPENDFLCITDSSPTPLIQFLSDLKTSYDPNYVGLLNLAVDWTRDFAMCLSMFFIPLLDQQVYLAAQETLTQLHEVFFISTLEADSADSRPHSTPKTTISRSLLKATMGPSFERLQCGPRSIIQDLEDLASKDDTWEEVAQYWFELLREWPATPLQTRYQLLLSFDQDVMRSSFLIHGSGDLESLLKDGHELHRCIPNHDLYVVEGSEPRGVECAVATGHPIIQVKNAEKVSKHVFGFWLVPLDVKNPHQEMVVAEDTDYLEKQIIRAKWHQPELALINGP